MRPPAFEGQIKCHLSHHPSHFTTQQNHSRKVHLKSPKSWICHPGCVFTAPLETWQAGLALHHTLCYGVFFWVHFSSKQRQTDRETDTHTFRDCAVRCQSRRELRKHKNKALVCWTSPLKVDSWTCLEIAIKIKSVHIYTVARHVPSESASRADFLLVTNWVILYEFMELF